jgi:hypothetical protein
MSLLLWNRYKQAVFCFEELILSQPTNALYHLGYAEVSALIFLLCSHGFDEATIFLFQSLVARSLIFVLWEFFGVVAVVVYNGRFGQLAGSSEVLCSCNWDEWGTEHAGTVWDLHGKVIVTYIFSSFISNALNFQCDLSVILVGQLVCIALAACDIGF